MNLLETYNKILSNPGKWKYYSRMDLSGIRCEASSLFRNDNNARGFIERYFQAGNKLNVFYDHSQTGMESRWTHTLSVFLLGIVLSDVLGIDMTEENECHNKANLYHWFLTCLYHDYGYVIEKNPSVYPPREYRLHKLYRDCNGNPKYYLRNRKRESEFSDSVRWRYYEWGRRKRDGFVNHGIIGGLMLYSQLCEFLEMMIKNHGGQTDFIDDNIGLHYSINQITDFALGADAIIAHNIWFNVSPLSELKLIDGERHVYKQWLTALLVLCDTIEPLKAFPDYDYISVLENINIDFNSITDSINISGDYSGVDYSQYLGKCESLKTWTYAKVDKDDRNVTLNNIRQLYRL